MIAGFRTSASSLTVKWPILAVMALVCLGRGFMMQVDFRSSLTFATLTNKNTSIHTHSSKSSCRELMSHSQFASGEFLTNPALPHAWVPRVDDSREFQHGLCDIHRYTSDEAKRCLVGKHLNFIGDSVSRYGALSLAYFLHKNKWPPRFGFELPYCRRYDENRTAVCSTEEDPNLTIRGNFFRTRFRPADTLARAYYSAQIGGWTDGGIFNGRLECNCVADVENWVYVTPKLEFALKRANEDNEYANMIVISMNSEKGKRRAVSLRGFNYSGCFMTGTCRFNQTDIIYWKKRVMSGDLDWTQDLLDFFSPDGSLVSQLPPVDIVMYNRGLWGVLTKARSRRVFPLLYNYSGRANRQCFYRTTVSAKAREPEIGYVRAHALEGQCSFFDFAGIAEDFVDLHSRKEIHRGNENWTMMLPQQEERYSVFVDEDHYQPWVYEEFNNLWLNVLCNRKPL
jgi:hypothetical protein